MDRRTLPSLALGGFAVACAAGAMREPPKAPVHQTEELSEGPAEDSPEGLRPSRLTGVVIRDESGEPIEGAIVTVACECLGASREMSTDAEGAYAFSDLPAGKYTIRVSGQNVEAEAEVDLPAGVRFHSKLSARPYFVRVQT